MSSTFRGRVATRRLRMSTDSIETDSKVLPLQGEGGHSEAQDVDRLDRD